MLVMHVKAKAVSDNKNGTWALEIEGTPLSVEDQKTLERLFPSLSEGVYRLLDQEALLAAIATPADVAAEPKNRPIEAVATKKRDY